MTPSTTPDDPMRIPALLPLLLAAALAAPTSRPAAAIAPGYAAPAARQDAEVERLIAEGRKLLALKKATEAEGLFQQAAELDGSSFRTRMWVLRAWMDQGGRSNDTLTAIDELAETHDGPELDYLYGMAWERRAEEQLAQGALGALNMNFGTAVDLLSKAVATEPDRFADAFQPLARAAWYQGDLDVARKAADEAVRRFPKSADAAFDLGRIAFSQFVEAQKDPEAAAEADTHWQAARDAFRRTIELLGTPNKRDWATLTQLAQAHRQLGDALMWRQLADEAKPAYTKALTLDPGAVDCAQLLNTLGLEGLREVLEQAAPAFENRFGKSDARDAAMLWWLGYARFAAQEHEAAEEAFLEAVDKTPGYANAWFYIAMSRYSLKSYDGATQALLAGWDLDPEAILREMQSNPSLNTAKVEYLIVPCVEAARFQDAANLAEICAETALNEAHHWNNLGFFLREEGSRLANVEDPTERERAERVFERSLTAYERALDLSPEDPTYLNDTAVVLHYYLDRDLDHALALYEAAAEKAQATIQAGGLSPEAMDLVRTALRDATNNRRALKKVLDERARQAAEEAARKKAEEEARKREQQGGGGDGGGDATGAAGSR